MTITTVSSRKFNQDISKIKKESINGPVLITDRGQPAHVLLSIDDYKKLTVSQSNIVDMLAMSNSEEVDFTPPKLDKSLYHPVDLS